jgi:hypothetical protein
MTVAEHIAELQILDPNAEIFFTLPEPGMHIYVVSKLPDGTKVLAEVPTAVIKPKENK